MSNIKISMLLLKQMIFKKKKKIKNKTISCYQDYLCKISLPFSVSIFLFTFFIFCFDQNNFKKMEKVRDFWHKISGKYSCLGS